MKTLDTRDLYKRKCEFEDLKATLETAREEMEEAQKARDEFEPETVLPDHLKDLAEKYGQTEAEALALHNRGRLNELNETASEKEADFELAEEAFSPDEAEELAELEELENQISDFMHGETMIEEDDFTEYAEQLADELGYMSGEGADKWPFTHIDWSAAAEELKQDYTSVTYQGTDYLVRS